MVEARVFIGKEVTVTVDRAMGSKHPKHGFIYPINYGFIADTKAADGEELDAYILGIHEPVEIYKGTVIAVIIRTDDDDPKLVVAPTGKEYSDDAILALVEFQEKFFKARVVRGKN